MPLPSDPKLAWPPKELARILPAMGQWSAWYAGDLAQLQAAYGGGIAADSTGFFASDQGGFKAAVGRQLQRWFVGEHPPGNARNTKLPIPIAAEMCQASADLLFSDPVAITLTKPKAAAPATPAAGDAKPEVAKTKAATPTEDRLATLLDDNFNSTIAEGAELGAALGGTYLRVTWDVDSNPDGPFTTTKDADTAIPEFKWGRLTAVTFWSVIARDGKHVWRHLERHEVSTTPGETFGNGVILHGLYMGTDDELGVRTSLDARPETASLAIHADVNLPGTIDTKSPGLAVTYIPNQTPNRMWRTDAIGRHLGRSDLDGVEHLMDQLAETMSDWMRARRAARARVMVSKDLVKNLGPGNGTAVDLDQETYVKTDFAGGVGPSGGQSLTDRVQVVQPTYRPEEFKATADALIEQILQMAGYSMQTFGVQPDGGGERTATEIESKERRSLMTRDRKIREWTPGLREHVKKLLSIDRDIFDQPNVWADIDVEFSDGVQESQLKLGQFVQALFASESASLRERVSILHPDWDDDQIDEEVDLIRAEFPNTHEPIMPPDFGQIDQAGVNNGATAA